MPVWSMTRTPHTTYFYFEIFEDVQLSIMAQEMIRITCGFKAQ